MEDFLKMCGSEGLPLIVGIKVDGQNIVSNARLADGILEAAYQWGNWYRML